MKVLFWIVIIKRLVTKNSGEEKIFRQQKKEDSANTESISSRVEMEVMKPVEPRRKLTRNSDAQL